MSAATIAAVIPIPSFTIPHMVSQPARCEAVHLASCSGFTQLRRVRVATTSDFLAVGFYVRPTVSFLLSFPFFSARTNK